MQGGGDTLTAARLPEKARAPHLGPQHLVGGQRVPACGKLGQAGRPGREKAGGMSRESPQAG